MLNLDNRINDFLPMYNKKIKELLKDKNVKIILYGSYARGDFKQNSDIDIMILANVEPDEVSIYADKIYDLTYDFEVDYDIEINPTLQSQKTYDYWKEVYPFFINIEKEGVVSYLKE